MALFRIALATAAFPASLREGLDTVVSFVEQAAERRAALVCFPESYLPGMRGIDEPVAAHDPAALKAALDSVSAVARRREIGVILPMDWDHPAGILNAAMVISPRGELLGMQTKNQLDPSEDAIFVAGQERQLFEIGGVTFGICICHEGFRYPESVRWSAARGASIVFHPHCTGSNHTGHRLTEWRGKNNRYFEHAMTCRALENNVYFASVNYAFTYQESTTALIEPDGECLAWQPYGKPGLLVADIEPERATGHLARRFASEQYR